MRALVIVLLLSASVVGAQGLAPREGRPMDAVARARCSGDCLVMARRRVGRARVWVQRTDVRRGHGYTLLAEVGRQRYTHFLGADGEPGYGGDMPQSYSLDRIEPVEIDGDPATPEIVVLGYSSGQPTATVCRLAPTPCCLYDMVAGRAGARLRAPTFDGAGRLVTTDGPVALRFCAL